MCFSLNRCILFTFSLLLFSGIYSTSYARYQTPETIIENPEWGEWQDRANPVIEFETVQSFGALYKSLSSYQKDQSAYS